MRFALLAVFLIGIAPQVSFSGETKKKQPNILFLFSDDQRADTIGALGNPHVQTPNLDKLVRRGLAFSRYYIMGGNSGAVCVPSRAMMLSGKSFFTVPQNLGTTTTWPMVLRQLGYRVGFTGKWHNGAPSAALSFPGAKNVFLGGMSDQFAVKLADLPATGKVDAKFSAKDLRVGTKHTSEIFAEEAIRFLKQKDGKPWAFYVAFTAPHDPREAPKEFHAKFTPKDIPVPPNYLPEHPFDNGEMKVRDEALEKWPRTKEAIQKHLAEYYAIIAHLDAQIGRILQELEASGELENTIIVFAADNGLAIGSHGLMGKQNLYNHSVRVPLIMAGPGIPVNQKSDAMVYSIDLCPTLCEWAGGHAPESIHGKSLTSLIKGQTTSHRDALYFNYRGIQRAVYDGRYKAIWYKSVDRWQLFDLMQDPHEIRDLVDHPNHSVTLVNLKKRMASLRETFGDSK